MSYIAKKHQDGEKNRQYLEYKIAAAKKQNEKLVEELKRV